MADRWTYRPELDGLRSVAVYLVVLFHCGVGPFDGGFVGVDLFFVLSGFLVSHVIWAEVDKHGSFRLGWFYARRVRRLLPAAVLVIVATAALQLLVASAPQREGMVRDGQSALVYLSNWHFIAEARDYFAADAVGASPYLHFWSLSIEEQFYVALPLALLLLLRLRRHAVVVLLLLSAVVAGSVALQLWQAASDPTYAYYATGTRVYQLAAGVLLASVTRLVTIPRGLGRLLSVVGLAGVVVVGSALLDVSASTRGLLATVASVAVIAGLYAAPNGEAATRAGPALAPLPRAGLLRHLPVALADHPGGPAGLRGRAPRPRRRRRARRHRAGGAVLRGVRAPDPSGQGARPVPAGPSWRPASARACSRRCWCCHRCCTPPCARPWATPTPATCPPSPPRRRGRTTPCRPGSTCPPPWPTYRTRARACTPDDLEACVRVTGDGAARAARRRQPGGDVRDGVRVAWPASTTSPS